MFGIEVFERSWISWLHSFLHAVQLFLHQSFLLLGGLGTTSLCLVGECTTPNLPNQLPCLECKWSLNILLIFIYLCLATLTLISQHLQRLWHLTNQRHSCLNITNQNQSRGRLWQNISAFLDKCGVSQCRRTTLNEHQVRLSSVYMKESSHLWVSSWLEKCWMNARQIWHELGHVWR